MPLIDSAYPGAPKWQAGGHLQTIWPNLFRKVPPIAYRRHRLELEDGDFLDLDFSFSHHRKGTLIIGHGLEGSADRPYVRGMAHLFAQEGWRICAINFRSCSGQLNRLRRMYHHGDYPDLQAVLEYLQLRKLPRPFVYVGFSMGGNIGLNLVSRRPETSSQLLDALIAFSSPLYLGDSIAALDNRLGKVYSRRFWKALAQKLEAKAEIHDIPNLETLRRIGNWDAFDRAFSLPLHDYPPDAQPVAFYDDVSPVGHLEHTRVPTLIVQALTDPMLGGRCDETAFAKTNPTIFLEHPTQGGHVGFAVAQQKWTYSETRSLSFAKHITGQQ